MFESWTVYRHCLLDSDNKTSRQPRERQHKLGTEHCTSLNNRISVYKGQMLFEIFTGPYTLHTHEHAHEMMRFALAQHLRQPFNT